MQPVAIGVATFILFGGQNLDGWARLSGDWGIADGAMVCRQAPASIRSVYESDQFVLRFEYRRAGSGVNRLYVHSRMTTGGTGIRLTPAGVAPLGGDAASTAVANAPADEWIHVELAVRDGRLKGRATRQEGQALGDFDLPVEAGGRGFLRFECEQSGLELRRVEAAEPGFASLFDGRSLDGWEVVRPKDPDDPGWTAANGVLQCRGLRSSWLRTLRTYDNLILRLEYQLPPRGNSGIYLRAPMEGRVSRIGLEFQLLDDAGYLGRFKPAQFTGSVYDGIAPEVRVPCPPDEWHAIEILADGPHVRATLNGVQLYDAMLTDARKDANAARRPLATRRTVGFIGLQDHATPVRFRNIRVKELPGLRSSASQTRPAN